MNNAYKVKHSLNVAVYCMNVYSFKHFEGITDPTIKRSSTKQYR